MSYLEAVIFKKLPTNYKREETDIRTLKKIISIISIDFEMSTHLSSLLISRGLL